MLRSVALVLVCSIPAAMVFFQYWLPVFGIRIAGWQWPWEYLSLHFEAICCAVTILGAMLSPRSDSMPIAVVPSKNDLKRTTLPLVLGLVFVAMYGALAHPLPLSWTLLLFLSLLFCAWWADGRLKQNFFLALQGLSFLAVIGVLTRILLQGYAIPGSPDATAAVVAAAIFLALSVYLVRRKVGDRWIGASLGLGIYALISFPTDYWPFSALGDEGAFFEAASDIATWPLSKIDDMALRGVYVYSSHPFCSSLIQALFLRVAGASSVLAWRMEGACMVAIGATLIYLFLRRFSFDRKAAWFGAWLAAFNHYTVVFSKIGYNNLQSFFVLSLVLFCASHPELYSAVTPAVTLGLALACCFYVYPAALYCLPVAMLFAIFPLRANYSVIWRRLALASVTCLFLVVPLVTDSTYVTSKRQGIWVGHSPLNHVDPYYNIIQNFFRSFWSFAFTQHESHFVAISTLNPIAGTIVLLGICVCFKDVWYNRSLFLFPVAAALMAFFQATTGREDPSLTRLFLMLPLWAAFAAYLVHRAQSGFTRHILSLCVFVSLGFDLVQSFVVSPVRCCGYQNREALMLRSVQEVLSIRGQEPLSIGMISQRNSGLPGPQSMAQRIGYDKVSVSEALVSDGGTLSNESLFSLADRSDFIMVNPWVEMDLQKSIGESLTKAGYQECLLKAADGTPRLKAYFNHEHSPFLDCTILSSDHLLHIRLFGGTISVPTALRLRD